MAQLEKREKDQTKGKEVEKRTQTSPCQMNNDNLISYLSAVSNIPCCRIDKANKHPYEISATIDGN